ncbi:MAG TPA: hypothetical protein VMC84_01720 [Methanocella sp.]|uniref:hypothetical protein n=1 Tax=Methanocella sp. TaxID=2052833 RepID=UPI002CE3125F|nr:hypothetical protein [Methanocella sp.]HTY89872.1 hypothetical protein [Methanocella sp.]
MSRTRLLFGLLIIAALITAGCTGTKTMVGSDSLPAAGQSARADYQKYAGDLTTEISYLQNHYRLTDNATLDEYQAWLGGLADRIALCRQMYDNMSAASKTYLAYLNNSSDEYRNVTAEDARFKADIESLNRSYDQYAGNYDTSVKKMAALEEYRRDLNLTADSYNDLNNYASGTKVKSVSDYARFISGFKQKADSFESDAETAINAGEEYLIYLDPGSEEYKAVEANNKALQDNIGQCQNAYNKYKSDYDEKMGAQSAAQSTFKDYVDKVGKVSAMKTDLDKYRGTAQAMEKLDKSWLDGYRQKIDAFDAACNDAIASGNACKSYLDPSGSDYKSIDTNEKNMKDSMAAYEDNYKSLYATYRNLHPLGTITSAK